MPQCSRATKGWGKGKQLFYCIRESHADRNHEFLVDGMRRVWALPHLPGRRKRQTPQRKTGKKKVAR